MASFGFSVVKVLKVSPSLFQISLIGPVFCSVKLFSRYELIGVRFEYGLTGKLDPLVPSQSLSSPSFRRGAFFCAAVVDMLLCSCLRYGNVGSHLSLPC